MNNKNNHSMMPAAATLLAFWLGENWRTDWPGEATRRRWFNSTPTDDRQMAGQFGALLDAALQGGLTDWESMPATRLALVLLLDQFARNIFRGEAHAFAGDARALALVQSGIAAGMDASLPIAGRVFFYMPLMHAEELAAQQQCIACFETLQAAVPATLRPVIANNLKFAREHRDIIERFGRFPHRNAALGRADTPDETLYLETAKRYGQ